MNILDADGAESLLDALHAAAVRQELPYRFISAKPLPAISQHETKFWIQFQIQDEAGYVDHDCETLPVRVFLEAPEVFQRDLFEKVFALPWEVPNV